MSFQDTLSVTTVRQRVLYKADNDQTYPNHGNFRHGKFEHKGETPEMSDPDTVNRKKQQSKRLEAITPEITASQVPTEAGKKFQAVTLTVDKAMSTPTPMSNVGATLSIHQHNRKSRKPQYNVSNESHNINPHEQQKHDQHGYRHNDTQIYLKNGVALTAGDKQNNQPNGNHSGHYYGDTMSAVLLLIIIAAICYIVVKTIKRRRHFGYEHLHSAEELQPLFHEC